MGKKVIVQVVNFCIICSRYSILILKISHILRICCFFNHLTHPISSDFYNWNKVKIRYCDGASFAGHPESEQKVSSFLHWKVCLKHAYSI